MTSPVDPARVKDLLARVRDVPVNTQGASDSLLATIYTYLMHVKPDPKDGTLHWFCPRADDLTINAATFLIRLFAYNSRQVELWKQKFDTCMSGCCDCVRGLEEAKVTSKATYFGAFEETTLNDFYANFHEWELKTVIEALGRAGLSSDVAQSDPKLSLSRVPSAVLYRIVCNLRIMQDEKIMSILHEYAPPDRLTGWPTDPPPAGILVLLMDKDAELRRWTKNQIDLCKVVPIPKDQFFGGYTAVIDAVAHAVSTNITKSGEITARSGFSLVKSDHSTGSHFATDPVNLWAGFCDFIRLIPPDWLVASGQRSIDLRRLVIGHMHDVGPHFVDVLRCFMFLLRRLGSALWQGEGPEFPHVVFDAVKDNPSYSDMLQSIEPTKDRPWILTWFPELLLTLRELPVYGGILAKMMGFMCEELQHERFQRVRPIIMTAAIKLVLSALRKTESSSGQGAAVATVLSIHADVFVSVAFERSHNDPQWSNSRVAARELIMTNLAKDVDDVSAAITQLCRLLAGRETVALSCSIHQELWAKSYASIQMDDFDSISAIVSIVARSSHFDTLSKIAFAPALNKAQGLKTLSPAEVALDGINRSLTIFHGGFLDVLSKCANNTSTKILDLLRRPGVVKDIMVLMLSPVEDLQTATKMLVGQAFDVDVRLDCFRALLENLPDASLAGLFGFLETFIQYSPVVPEACSLSKSLVRCLTDVIEVLCAGNNGLLHIDHWTRGVDKRGPASLLPKLWSLMVKSITVIFKRTPLWSAYFEPEDMIVWMRDALIFGRDMLAQRRVIEFAAVLAAEQPSSIQTKTNQTSRLAKTMVIDLQEALPELARWLRLTDEELLHQSFALLQSLLECFRESQVAPSPAGIAKLMKHIGDARKKDPSRPQTRLDSTRLSKLEDALVAFDEDDDVQIISHFVPPSKQREPDHKSANDTASKSLLASTLKQSKNSHKVTPKPPLRPPTKVQFTNQDQQKLDKQVPLPTFRRKDKSSLPGTSHLPSSRSSSAGAKSDGASSSGPAESSDDSESEEESQAGLVALGKFQRSPKVKKPVERRQVKLLDIPTKGRSAQNDRLAQRNDARRNALRLKPDITGLHKALLSWSYDHVGPLPPSLGDTPQLLHVSDQFTDHDRYRKIFEPLLLLECWSQIVQSKDEKQETCDCKITSRQFIDNWLDFDVSISQPLPKDWYLAETDVVLLRHLDGKTGTLAKVQSYRAMPHGVQAAFRAVINQSQSDPGLQINSQWRLTKVFSLSTLHREYAALMALPYFDLFDKILRPHLAPIPSINSKDISQTMSTYKVNEPQAVAILGSMQVEGFALIQGPPGTGKTSTICGLVQTFLTNRSRPATTLHVGRSAVAADREPTKKILLCAPSNAAIDEVAHRLKELRPISGALPIKVVRIGTEKSMNITVKDISLDNLVEQRMNADQALKGTSPKDTSNETAHVRSEIEAVKLMKEQKVAELSSVQSNTAKTIALEEEIKKLGNRRMALAQQFDKLKDKRKNEFRSQDATRRKFRTEVLQEADVICSTLSGAGHEVLDQFDFEMVIIDEAAQAIELSSLIPLKFRCKRCIMVGDPQQLPPTVLSQEACKYKYNQSLFVRLQKHQPDAVHLLSIQYRMHPDISKLPSNLFYQGRLLDGPDMALKTIQPWHTHDKFGTYQFYNVARGQEYQAAVGHSIKNDLECQVAVALYNRIRQEFPAVDFDYRVGVVSMYRGQIMELQRAFQQRFGNDIKGKIHFSTVDGFQGQEKDIIILSCVRAGPGLQAVGFLSDVRRMNVALTRAKSSLFILGHAATLERSDETWRQIVQDARSRSHMIEADVSFFTSPNVPRVPVSRPLKAKPAATPTIAPLPLDLAMPRDLMKNLSIGSAAQIPESQTMQAPHGPEAKAGDSAAKLMLDKQDLAPTGQKRPADHDPAPQQAQSSTSNGDRPKLVPPPAKRQKKDKGSIFIPKKPNKRPA